MRSHTSPCLTVVAIFKNEGDIIGEWVRHYLSQGASQILLIDNNSSDDWRGALAELAADGRVTCLQDGRMHAQLEIYRDILHSGIIEGEWLLMCDLDEFIYARKSFSTISDYLGSLPDDVSGVALPWKLFGSSGHIQHPRGRSVDNFLWRGVAAAKVLGKTISRTRRIEGMEVHRHHYSEGSLIRSCGTPIGPNPFLDLDETRLDREVLHLNHYSIRSREFYEKVKMTRGRVFSTEDNYQEHYFRSRDQNEIRDDELSRLSAGQRPSAPEPGWFEAERHPLPPGPRPPLFRLLPPSEGLERPADRRPLQLRWQLEPPGPGSHPAGGWLDGGVLPADREETVGALVGLAWPALLPLARRLPLRIDASRSNKAARRRARQWCGLLGIRQPVAWLAAATPAGERWRTQSPEPQRDVQAWRGAALALARDGALQARLAQAPAELAIALPGRRACRGRGGQFERGLRPLLKALAREQGIPLLRLGRLPLEEQLLQWRRYRWIVGPFQPAMLLVHALGELPAPATLILLSRGVRRSRLVMERMQRLQRVPHRLLLLPPGGGAGAPGGDDDRRVIGDLIAWLRSGAEPQGAAAPD